MTKLSEFYNIKDAAKDAGAEIFPKSLLSGIDYAGYCEMAYNILAKSIPGFAEYYERNGIKVDAWTDMYDINGVTYAVYGEGALTQGDYVIAVAEPQQEERGKMELMEALPALPELEEIVEKAHWEKRAFVHALGLGNALISQADTDSYTRYLLHQQYNRRLSELRAKKLGEEAEVVFGFFRHGEAEEVSLFSGYPEIAEKLFRGKITALPSDLIIGYGCKDCSVTVVAVFDTSVNHNWGWEDGYGEHVEFYDAASRTFYRSSMSGRTCYRLKIDDNGIAIPQP